MNIKNLHMKYLMTLKSYVPNVIGFDEVFSDIPLDFLQVLVSMIIDPELYKGMYINQYDEVVDFLDGNGFKVEGNDRYGYTITRLNT